MHTFLIKNENLGFDGFAIICPLCGVISDRLDIDDYVDENIVLWCPKHCEILLCLSSKSLSALINNDERSCAIKTNGRDLLDFYRIHGYGIPEEIGTMDNKTEIYRIGILRITDIISSTEFDSDDDSEYGTIDGSDRRPPDYLFHKVDDVCFMDIDHKDIYTYHGGIELFYKGDCLQCGKHFESKIWGG